MNNESRKVLRNEHTFAILPPEVRGDVWHGSSRVDSWEETRQRNERMRANTPLARALRAQRRTEVA